MDLDQAFSCPVFLRVKTKRMRGGTASNQLVTRTPGVNSLAAACRCLCSCPVSAGHRQHAHVAIASASDQKNIPIPIPYREAYLVAFFLAACKAPKTRPLAAMLRPP